MLVRNRRQHHPESLSASTFRFKSPDGGHQDFREKHSFKTMKVKGPLDERTLEYWNLQAINYRTLLK